MNSQLLLRITLQLAVLRTISTKIQMQIPQLMDIIFHWEVYMRDTNVNTYLEGI
jgi:hypothetical protein